MTTSGSHERGDAARLSEVVSIRLTPAEMDILRAVAGPRPLSQFVRELCSNAMTTPLRSAAVSQCSTPTDVPLVISMNVPLWTAPVARQPVLI
jgi:hypothetical protein